PVPLQEPSTALSSEAVQVPPEARRQPFVLVLVQVPDILFSSWAIVPVTVKSAAPLLALTCWTVPLIVLVPEAVPLNVSEPVQISFACPSARIPLDVTTGG